MAKLLIHVEEESPCNFCNEIVPLDVTADALIEPAHCSACDKDLYPRYTSALIYQMMLDGQIIDARKGGIVLGRDTPEDDIPMLAISAQGVFQVLGLMQGGEYILSAEASLKHGSRLEEIGTYKGDSYQALETIELKNTTRVFNTNDKSAREVWLLIDYGQYIISRAGTAKFYQELEMLNSST